MESSQLSLIESFSDYTHSVDFLYADHLDRNIVAGVKQTLFDTVKLTNIKHYKMISNHTGIEVFFKTHKTEIFLKRHSTVTLENIPQTGFLDIRSWMSHQQIHISKIFPNKKAPPKKRFFKFPKIQVAKQFCLVARKTRRHLY